MRLALPLIALVLAGAASAQQAAPVQLLAERANPNTVCRDRIHEVRRELAQPALDRSAAPAEPLFIAAVDKRVGGCSVMVMRNDTADIRPLPEPGEHRLMRAR